MFNDNAFGADVDLFILTKELSSFVRMFQAVLLSWLLLLLYLLLLLLGWDMPLTVQVVEDGEILDQLFDIWREVAAASRAREDVWCAEVHQAMLAEGMAACQDSGDLLFVIVLVETDWASDFHFVGSM